MILNDHIKIAKIPFFSHFRFIFEIFQFGLQNIVLLFFWMDIYYVFLEILFYLFYSGKILLPNSS